ncbi:hypothetical protein NGM37_42770, partial [Streptomyces sp. TRM76130]|nr:hypothetical protein [Streptomyces sp. TRM76130]
LSARPHQVRTAEASKNLRGTCATCASLNCWIRRTRGPDVARSVDPGAASAGTGPERDRNGAGSGA